MKSPLYSDWNSWMKPCSELYTSTVIWNHLINYRTFSSSAQNIPTEHSFEHFLFQMNFTYITKTNLCTGVGKITEYHLTCYYSSVMWFVRCNYWNFSTEITNIGEQVLVGTICFSQNLQSYHKHKFLLRSKQNSCAQAS